MNRGSRVLLACLGLTWAVDAPVSPVVAGETQVHAPNAPASPQPSLSPGESVPAFDAEGLDGVIKHVAYPKGSSTVLLFFLSGCQTCHRMIPEWSKAYERRPKNLQVIGILMDREPPGYFMATPISFPVVRSPGKDFLGTFKAHRAPLTLRVGPGGKVQDVGMGHLDPIRLGELFRP